jgi:hypothetical protein
MCKALDSFTSTPTPIPKKKKNEKSILTVPVTFPFNSPGCPCKNQVENRRLQGLPQTQIVYLKYCHSAKCGNFARDYYLLR